MKRETMVCKKCRRVLSEYVKDGCDEVVWIHFNELDDDHPAEPMPQREMTTVNFVCDFCTRPSPEENLSIVYTAEVRVPVNGSLTLNAGEAWASCPECTNLIQAKEWDLLTERSADCFLATHPGYHRDSVVASLREIQSLVRDGFIRVDPASGG